MVLSDYLALFPGYTREKPRFMALAEAVLRQAADFAPVIAALGSAFSLDGAVGVRLDLLGESFGLPRAGCPSGEDDESYRAFLRRKLKLWTWDGTNEGCADILDAMTEFGRPRQNPRRSSVNCLYCRGFRGCG